MRKFSQILILLWGLLFLDGCVIVEEPLDYRHGISDYEAKRIVRKVFLSQHSLADASLLTSVSFGSLLDDYAQIHYDPYANRYGCDDRGYFTLQLGSDGLQLTIDSGDLLEIEYQTCQTELYSGFAPQLNGPVAITYHQNRLDRYSRMLDFTVTYHDALLTTLFGAYYLEGSIGVHYDEDMQRGMLALVLSSNRFQLYGDRYTQRDRFDNVVLDFTMDTISQRYRYNYSGTLYNSYLGRLTFSTFLPLEGIGDQNPATGELKIGNAQMRLIVTPLDDYYVDIQLISNSDPRENRTIHTTWLNIGL